MTKDSSAQKILTSSQRKLNVIISGGPHKGESFEIDKNTFTIGRGPENQIILANDTKISRTHVRVTKENQVLKIENQSKRNPIFYQGLFKELVELVTNGRIVIGDSEITFDWIDIVEQEYEPAKANPTQQPKIMLEHPAQPPSLSPSTVPTVPTVPTTPTAPPVPVNLTSQKPSPQISPKPLAKAPDDQLKPQIPDPYKPIPAKKSKKQNAPTSKGNNTGFLILIIIVIGVVFFLMPEEKKKGKKGSALRTPEEYQKEIELSNQAIETYRKHKNINEDGSIVRQFESAQTYYVKGFRDYRNGQYSRAISSFQAALSFDPNHTLSRKYLNLSIQKYDSLTQFNMNQARRYREKNNFRLCKSAAQQVLILRKDPNDSLYKEAKQILDECDILSKGRY